MMYKIWRERERERATRATDHRLGDDDLDFQSRPAALTL